MSWACFTIVSILIPFSTEQCLTQSDEIRQVDNSVHQSLLHSELQFSADLLRTVGGLQPAENVIFSPTSVFKALLMAYFISANATEASLKKGLHLPEDKDKLDILGAYTLDNYYQKLRMAKSDHYQLSSANRMYVAKNLRVNHCMKVLFGEEILPANFEENLSGAVRKINNWVSEQTRKVIKDFLIEDQVSVETQLIVVNAAYFKGLWKNPFPPEGTRNRTFHLTNGTKVKTPMMTQENQFKYTVLEDLEVEAVELPYKGDDVSLVLLLPLKESPSALPRLLAKLDLKNLQRLVQTLNQTHPDTCSVTMPKFTVDHSLELTQILESMGVGDLFKDTVDLSTLARDGGLKMTDAVHKASMRVDEVGSEAAAATALISARMGHESFLADHPFIYFIHDYKSNVILFLGMYNSPQSS